MSTQPYLRPTVTQRVRGFLDEVGVAPRPWAPLDDVSDTLWRTLHERRDDAAFWARLERLLRDLEADATCAGGAGLAHPAAEIIGRTSVDKLVRELRAAVRRAPDGKARGAFSRMLPRLSAPVAGCLLLLAACSGGRGGSTPSDTARPTPMLETYLAESQLDDAAKASLTRCFGDWETARKQDLAALFRDKPAEEIARALEALLAPGGDCAEASQADASEAPPDTTAPADAGTEPSPPDAGVQPVPDAAVPVVPADAGTDHARHEPPPVPVYKGVAF